MFGSTVRPVAKRLVAKRLVAKRPVNTLRFDTVPSYTRP